MVSYLNTEPNVELQTSKCMKCWLNMIYVHLHQGYGLSVVDVVHALMPSAK